jgi:flagellar assembly protein FliH
MALPAAARSETPQAAPPAPQVDVAAIEREWEARVAAAHASGVREGEKTGRERAAAELQPLLQRLARSIDEVATLRPRLRREAEADMVKLALAIARRVIRREVTVDPEALHGLVLGALERLQAQEVSRVRVHPAHAAQVAALLRERPGCEAVEVIADGSGDLGAAVFETTRGNLDASVESQLGEIERGLADALRRAG